MTKVMIKKTYNLYDNITVLDLDKGREKFKHGEILLSKFQSYIVKKLQ